MKIKVLIPAAGKGTRSGLHYPKCLYEIRGRPILVRICHTLAPIDKNPTVIVSPKAQSMISECLKRYGLLCYLVKQPSPKGMGDAVLRFIKSPAYLSADEILLVWGDIPFIQPQTVSKLLVNHRKHKNHFTLVTKEVDSAYTIVKRDERRCVQGVWESRELGIEKPRAGERDIGLFCFNKKLVLDLLQEDLPDKYGRLTGEHGFLYVIHHLCKRGYKVEALPVATDLDLVSLNSLSDLGKIGKNR